MRQFSRMWKQCPWPVSIMDVHHYFTIPGIKNLCAINHGVRLGHPQTKILTQGRENYLRIGGRGKIRGWTMCRANVEDRVRRMR